MVHLNFTVSIITVNVQVILIICGFCICRFVYLLAFACNPKSIFAAPSWSSTYKFSDEVKQGNTLPSCFSCHTVNKCPFLGLFSATFLHFGAFCWWIHYFNWPPILVLRLCVVSLSTRRLCLTMTTSVLDKLHSGMSNITVARSSMWMNQYILNKVSLKRNTHKMRLYIDWLTNQL